MTDSELALLRQDEVEWSKLVDDTINVPTVYLHSRDALLSLVCKIPELLRRLAAARA